MAGTTEGLHIPDGYHVTYDAAGALTGIEADAPNPSLTQAAVSYVTARAAEPSTYAGIGIGAVASQALAGNVVQAVTSGLMGDYVGMIQHGAPVVIAAGTAIMSILHRENSTKIAKLVAGMSREELLKICNL
jgi:hypothetical protein